MQKTLYRSSSDRVVAGVCGGIAEYFNIDSAIIRILWALAVFMEGFGLLAYLIASVIIPKRGEDSDYAKVNSEPSESMLSQNRAKWFGVALVAFGGYFLFKNLFGWVSIAIIWPVILIGMGLVVLVYGIRGN